MHISWRWLVALVGLVVIACSGSSSAPTKYSIGGTVTGLQGTGLVLQNNGGDDLSVAPGSSSITFASKVDNGTTYAVTVLTQPTNPAQTCSVSGGSGTVSGANVTSVIITCSTQAFQVSGTVSGLVGSGLVLRNNGGDDLTVPAGASSFSFVTPVASGAAYAVTVQTDPTSPWQTCTVSNGSGTIDGADVTNVAVACTTRTFHVGVTVSGLSGTGLVLRNNGGDDLAVPSSGAYQFSTAVASGGPYAVTVFTHPTNPAQLCGVTSGTGTVTDSDITSVSVTCVTNAYTIGGTVTGLTGTGLVLTSSINGGAGEDHTVASSDTGFTFSTPGQSGSTYAVTVKTQPQNPWQTCSVTSGGTGTISNANITDVAVTCTVNHYPIHVAVSGLTGAGPLVLQNNGGNNLTATANSTYTFSTEVNSGQAYAVTVLTQPVYVNPSNPAQTCVVSSGSGTVAGSAVTINVSCTVNSYTVGGTVSGLAGSGLVLRNNGGDDRSITGNGSYAFTTSVASGASYAVTVYANPTLPWQTCTQSNGSGTVTNANVTNVAITCTTNHYTIGGTVSGLEGTGLVLLNNGGDARIVNIYGSFTFATEVNSGATYAVTIQTQPSGPTQTCSVSNGTGTVAGAAVTSVTVSCNPVVVVQRWVTQSTWGSSATSFWDVTDPNLVQHATFSATGAIQETNSSLVWSAQGSHHTPLAFHGFPAGVRYGAGPFDGPRFQATAGDTALDLTGDMLVCAVIKPDWNPVDSDYERVIIAKGLRNDSGWVLAQTDRYFSFWYQGGTTGARGAFTPTYLRDNGRDTGPLNPSYVVVCGGRDNSNGRLVVAANSFEDAQGFATWPSAEPLLAGHSATIGGYDTGNAHDTFNGRIYETAVWAEPATPANVQAKMAAVLGLTLPDGTVARYTRDHEAPYLGVDSGAYHTAWRHGPRIDVTKGWLFGVQGVNRVPRPENLELWTASAGATVTSNVRLPPGDSEKTSADQVNLNAGANVSTAMDNFTSAGVVHGQIWIYPVSTSGTLRVRSGATLAPENATFTAGTGTLVANTYAYRVTAFNGGSESAASAETSLTLSATGGVNVNWRPVTGATGYRIYGRTAGAEGLLGEVTGESTNTFLDDGSAPVGGIIPAPTWTSPWDLGHQDIDLSTLTAGQWNRIWITDLDTNGYQTSAGQATLYLENPAGAAAPIQLQVWGVDMTQVASASALGYDPGLLMYDTLGNSDNLDRLLLPAVAYSTGTGMCLSVDAVPADGMPWTGAAAQLDNVRTIIGWQASPTSWVHINFGGIPSLVQGDLIVRVISGTTTVYTHAPPPAGWTAGSRHNLKACVAPDGTVSLFGDDVLLGTPGSLGTAAVPDMLGGQIAVGNDVDGSTPWQGYVWQALACRYTGGSPSACQ